MFQVNDQNELFGVNKLNKIPQNEDDDEIEEIELHKTESNFEKEPSSFELRKNPIDADSVLKTRPVESELNFTDHNVVSVEQEVDEEALKRKEQERQEKKAKYKEKCMDVLKFSIKQTILIILVLAYASGGAFLFAFIERHNEARLCQEAKGADLINLITTKAWLIEYVQFNISSTGEAGKDNETYAMTVIENQLTAFRDQVISIGYGGRDCTATKWIFTNTLLFCLTIVTTIGYGQIFPKTWQGQIICICYALVGIPLFIMCLANISGVLGYGFRLMYVKICCGLCNLRKKKKADKQAALEQANKQLAEEANQEDNQMNMKTNARQMNEPQVVDDHEDIGNEMNETDEIENVSVPLTVTMIIITCYIMIGALMFNSFEGWPMVAAAYFCFVTLATIGFGDFVPGQNFSDPNGPIKLAAGCVYILIGLAVLGMAFDLMQEELIAKFTWFGKKIGLLETEEEEEDEEEPGNDDSNQENTKQNYSSNEKLARTNTKLNTKEPPNYN